MEQIRLPFKAYKMLCKLDRNGRYTWASNVWKCLSLYGFLHVWDNQGVESINSFLQCFKQRIIDCKWQEWDDHIDYLKNRLQYVWLNGVLSSVICTNTSGLQGTVLATFLFSLYTADCRSTGESCRLVKSADDIKLVGKISNDEGALYHKQTENFVNWCDKNYLYLNVS